MIAKKRNKEEIYRRIFKILKKCSDIFKILKTIFSNKYCSSTKIESIFLLINGKNKSKDKNMDENGSSNNITELNQIKSMMEICNITDISVLMKYLSSLNDFMSHKSVRFQILEKCICFCHILCFFST